MKLPDARPSGARRARPRRVGRGQGSGRGKTAGRGPKGQKSRAGSSVPAWFEGGQTPLHVRTPKLHGFKNRFRVEYDGVNLSRLADAAAGTLITPDVLRHDQVVRDRKTRPMPIKILGGGDAPRGVTIHAHAFTRSALEKLAAAGSTAQLISWPDGLPVEAEAQQADVPQPDAPHAESAAHEAAEASPPEAAAEPEPPEADAPEPEPPEADAPDVEEAAEPGDGSDE